MRAFSSHAGQAERTARGAQAPGKQHLQNGGKDHGHAADYRKGGTGHPPGTYRLQEAHPEDGRAGRHIG